ncbi:head completion/stabilization protein [Melaminivora sp.]|uniref:head completion/stabilization protein n=1 Tax=Melaminivora sp. TaxID=1933032 RepID=UPI0028AC3D1C|nr:head completion/stabilization protein [Melaminivora sp.]
MSFLATANPPAAGIEPAVVNDDFWPDIDPAQLRKDLRLDGTATPERLHLAIEAAMWAVNAELAEWQAQQLAAGHAQLADVPAPQLAGVNVKARQYRRAVYSHVQAQLAEAYRDLDTLPQGAGKEQRVQSALEIRIDGFNQQLRWAIADLQGKSRVIAELL